MLNGIGSCIRRSEPQGSRLELPGIPVRGGGQRYGRRPYVEDSPQMRRERRRAIVESKRLSTALLRATRPGAPW